MAARSRLQGFCLAIVVLLLAADLAPSPALAAKPLQQTCFNVIVNGGFESPSTWVLPGSPLPAAYSTTLPRTGAWAMQAGNVGQNASIEAYSTFRQTVTIPANAVSAQLSFWVWTFTEPNPGNDLQQALLLVPGASVLSASSNVLWSERSNSGAYRFFSFPVGGQIGRTFDLAFSVSNDGFGGRTWMYVDDVRLEYCLPGPTATPTATPMPLPTATPTPTFIPTPVLPSPIPPGCVDILANGGFEWTGAWIIGSNPILPFYAGSPNPVYSGSRSIALGAVSSSSPSNVASFSSIQQAVTLPATAQTAQIRFWYYPNSSAAAGGFNRQELILLDPLNYEETIEVLWRVTQNNATWLLGEIDLTRYLGRTVTVYFNARNAGDGTRTGMFLDQVELLVCGVAAIMPLAKHDAYPEALPQSEIYVWPEALPQSEADVWPEALPQSEVDVWPEALPQSEIYVWPGAEAPAIAVAPEVLATVAAMEGPTVVAVGATAAPIPAIAPATTLATPTATAVPTRRDREPLIDLDQIDSPWLIILVISGVILLAVVLAVIVFTPKG